MNWLKGALETAGGWLDGITGISPRSNYSFSSGASSLISLGGAISDSFIGDIARDVTKTAVTNTALDAMGVGSSSSGLPALPQFRGNTSSSINPSLGKAGKVKPYVGVNSPRQRAAWDQLSRSTNKPIQATMAAIRPTTVRRGMTKSLKEATIG